MLDVLEGGVYFEGSPLFQLRGQIWEEVVQPRILEELDNYWRQLAKKGRTLEETSHKDVGILFGVFAKVLNANVGGPLCQHLTLGKLIFREEGNSTLTQSLHRHIFTKQLRCTLSPDLLPFACSTVTKHNGVSHLLLFAIT